MDASSVRMSAPWYGENIAAIVPLGGAPPIPSRPHACCASRIGGRGTREGGDVRQEHEAGQRPEQEPSLGTRRGRQPSCRSMRIKSGRIRAIPWSRHSTASARKTPAQVR